LLKKKSKNNVQGLSRKSNEPTEPKTSSKKNANELNKKPNALNRKLNGLNKKPKPDLLPKHRMRGCVRCYDKQGLIPIK